MSDTPSLPFDGKAFVAQLTTAPGVYRMYAADNSLLYVGKARALRKRVANYFSASPKTPRIEKMVSQIARMDVTITASESEALVLENQLIKSLNPRYNVALRDDKAYPYLLLTSAPWSRLVLHRGAKSVAGRYFGPYPSIPALRDTLNLIFKLFKLRSCEDSVFRNRTRPCLQHQIGRCSAPCVERISPEAYQTSVNQATLLLEGRSDQLTNELTVAMQTASDALDFEQAAYYRDLIRTLRTLQTRQYLDGRAADLDALACAIQGGQACVMLLVFRDGRNFGTRAFFPKTNGEENADEILGAFVSQYYANYPAPAEVILDREIPDADLIESALTAASGYKVQLKWKVRAERASYIALAQRNAEATLLTELNSQSAQHARSQALSELVGLTTPVSRIECFDISHTQGEATVASCVVFDAAGAVRSQYRRYNITGITPGDDYAAMHQALQRRFTRAMEENGVLPDILLIDGGLGQLNQAKSVLVECGITSLAVIGVAKGVERRAGDETLVFPDGREIQLGAASPALQFIQQVRDEAHRFAITGHRGKRQKTRNHSQLEDIPGIGTRRRTQLLKHFGGLTGLKAATQEEIAKVDGIHLALAARIYAHLHGLTDPSK